MSLKDKLRNLIEATFTSKKEFIVQQNAVNYSDQSSTSVVSNQQFVSPINGYARLHATIESDSGELSVDYGLSDRLITTQSRQSGNWLDFLFPVTKGNTYRVVASDASSITLTYFSMIGGGLKRLFSEVAYVF